jgi:hypothetical protein
VTNEEQNSSGAPARNYVVLERIQEDDGSYYYVELATVEARNANNALRRAWKQQARGGDQDVWLVPVPDKWFRPRLVSGKARDEFTVEIRDPEAVA